MSARTPVCELLGIDHPVVSAPMAADPRLPAAVSNAGALGTIGLWWVEDAGELVRETAALTDRPFGGNFALTTDQHRRVDQALSAGLRIVSFIFGDPQGYVDSVHDVGGLVMHTVCSAEEAVLRGAPPALSIPGRGVRPATEVDLDECGELCARVHGHDRNAELADAIAAGSARVVERPDRISGYATGFGYGWHAVAETNEDLVALLSSAEAFIGLGILVPSRNPELLGWCLEHGLRIVQQSTLMTIGLYNEPAGAYLPSILF